MLIRCPTCKREQELEAYHRDRTRATGRAVQCRKCASEASRKRRQLMAARSEEELLAATPEFKRCSGACKQTKSAAEFSRSKSSADALKPVCRECSAKLWRRWKDGKARGQTLV